MALEGPSRHSAVHSPNRPSPHTLPDSYTLRPREAAKYLSISERKLREHLRQGDIPYAKLERAVLIPVRALQEFIDSRTDGGQE